MTQDILSSKAYELGVKIGAISAFCEAAASEAKSMSLSSLFLPADFDLIDAEARRVAEENGVHLYLEKSLLATDLFPNVDTAGKWVYVIYKKKEFLDRYLDLKEEKERLVKAGQYSGDARLEIARNFGRILGYSEGYLEGRLKAGSRKTE